MPRIALPRRLLLGGLAALAIVPMLGVLATEASAKPPKSSPCPTFHVVKPDPAAGYRAGIYDMSVAGKVSCKSAVSLFIRYLDNPKSGLPKGWSHQKYYAGFTGPGASFAVFQPTKHKTHHTGGTVTKCATDQAVENNRVGFRTGLYALVVFGKTSCKTAHSVFLSYISGGGLIPGGYQLSNNQPVFFKNKGKSGFQYILRESILPL